MWSGAATGAIALNTGTMQPDLATKAHRAGDEVQREVGEAEDTFQDRVHAARLARFLAGACDHHGRQVSRMDERVRGLAEQLQPLLAGH